VHELPADRPLYVICATGGRSLRAATALQNQAGIEAVSVAGGTRAWIESGRDYDTGAAED
jgi:rhodanese-related sulfurtransferase